ncbi:hypothetical protein CISIN_1g015228mg [Citrus sinensis]|uniref:RING-type domain-containing protein n=1 Tax=Citrus sinensis TaxID=2711 RepID=A0A067GW92_CITSI|nr:hypothetical protein CISIN_1g015228mg [Citrus sinensis]
MGPHEPYWQTNTSFSPPPSRWDFRFQSEGLPYGSNDGFHFYGSSTSSNSKESKSGVRGNLPYNNQNSASDSAGLFLSSSSDLSQGPQWTPPAIQEITIDGYETPTRRDPVSTQFSFTPAIEGTSANPYSRGSTSSRSDSKDDTSTPQWEAHRWSSASSSVDFADVSEPFESESFGQSYVPSDTFKCGLCERFLSQRSPWSSRRIVRSGDMPVVGVLSCRHVFHAECLEQTTPKTQKSDPSCPICLRLQEENSPDQQVFSRLKNSFPRLRQSCDNGQSRPWGCPQAGGCVEGASHVPPRNTVLLLNRNRVKKNLSLKGNSSKEFPGKLRKTGACSSQLFNGKTIDPVVGCAKTTAGPSMRR